MNSSVVGGLEDVPRPSCLSSQCAAVHRILSWARMFAGMPYIGKRIPISIVGGKERFSTFQLKCSIALCCTNMQSLAPRVERNITDNQPTTQSQQPICKHHQTSGVVMDWSTFRLEKALSRPPTPSPLRPAASPPPTTAIDAAQSIHNGEQDHSLPLPLVCAHCIPRGPAPNARLLHHSLPAERHLDDCTSCHCPSPPAPGGIEPIRCTTDFQDVN